MSTSVQINTERPSAASLSSTLAAVITTQAVGRPASGSSSLSPALLSSKTTSIGTESSSTTSAPTAGTSGTQSHVGSSGSSSSASISSTMSFSMHTSNNVPRSTSRALTPTPLNPTVTSTSTSLGGKSVMASTSAAAATSYPYGTSIGVASTSLVLFTNPTPTPTGAPQVGTLSTSSPEPTSTSISLRTHEITIDAGNCTGVGTPTILNNDLESVKLTSLGGGRFTAFVQSGIDRGFGGSVFLADDGSRCGAQGECVSVYVNFGPVDDIYMVVARSGDRGQMMYPLSMWLEDGVTWDGKPANGPESMYHCWGWKEAECPNSYMYPGDPDYTLSSESQTAHVYIEFCPTDGPALSNVLPNPSPSMLQPTQDNTLILLPTSTVVPISTFVSGYTSAKGTAPTPTITRQAANSNNDDVPECEVLSTCVLGNSFISVDESTTVFSMFTAYPTTESFDIFPTWFSLDSTLTVPVTTLFGQPPTRTPTLVSWVVGSTNTLHSTVQSGWTFSTVTGGPTTHPTTKTGSPVISRATDSISSPPTSTISDTGSLPISIPSPTVVPTFSAITDTLGVVISTMSYDLTIISSSSPSPTPPPQHVITSWTTYVTINGSTAPAIAGEVGVVSTIPVTYALEPDTTIPVAELSSRSIESMRTSAPSSTLAAAKNGSSGQDKGGTIAGAVVGTLVGLILSSLLVWFIFYSRRQKRSRDYLAQSSPAWLHSEPAASEAGTRSLDLDSGPRMRNSYVEPWVPPVASTSTPAPSSTGRKGSGGRSEMESISGGQDVTMVGGPSREPDSSTNESGTSLSHSSTDHRFVPATTPVRAGKSVVRSQPTRHPGPVYHERPALPHYLTSSLANPSLSLLPTPFPADRTRPPSPPSPPLPPRPPRQPPLEEDEQRQHDNAIPPLYNEAWNIAR